MNELNAQQKKNNRTVIIIFAMSIIPFCIAWYLSSNATWMGGGTNQGALITPPITTQFNEFIGFDSFSSDNLQEIKGRWIFVNVVLENECSEICQYAIFKTKQLRVMMGKGLTRTRRLALINPKIERAEEQLRWTNKETDEIAEDKRLLKAKLTPALLAKLNKAREHGIVDGMLLLMDPLGNIMMQYEPDFDPYKVKSDLRKLLKISQIG